MMQNILILIVYFSFQYVLLRGRIVFQWGEEYKFLEQQREIRWTPVRKIQGAGSISKILLQKELNHAGLENIAWNDDNRLDLLILQCIGHSVWSPVIGNELKETGDETQMLLQRESRYAKLT